MTKEEIEAMEPGRKLNIIVGKAFGFAPSILYRIMNLEETAYCIDFEYHHEAERYFIENKDRYENPKSTFFGYKLVEWEEWPNFSQNISAAWEVVEKMVSIGYRYTLNLLHNHHYPKPVRHACFALLGKNYMGDPLMAVMNDYIHYHSHCKTAPEAICKAALLAVLELDK